MSEERKLTTADIAAEELLGRRRQESTRQMPGLPSRCFHRATPTVIAINGRTFRASSSISPATQLSRLIVSSQI